MNNTMVKSLCPKFLQYFFLLDIFSEVELSEEGIQKKNIKNSKKDVTFIMLIIITTLVITERHLNTLGLPM